MSRFVKSKTKKKRKKERARRTYRDSKTSYHDITNPKALKVKWSMGPNPYSSKRVLSQKLCFQRKKENKIEALSKLWFRPKQDALGFPERRKKDCKLEKTCQEEKPRLFRTIFPQKTKSYFVFNQNFLKKKKYKMSF